MTNPIKAFGAESLMGFPGQRHYTRDCIFAAWMRMYSA